METEGAITAEAFARYDVSAEAYQSFKDWKEQHGVLFEQYPESFDLRFIYDDIALATHLLGFPVPLDVLPERSRPNEKKWTLVERVVFRVIVFEGWPRTYGSVYKQFGKLKVPHVLSNYALALAPVLKQ